MATAAPEAIIEAGLREALRIRFYPDPVLRAKSVGVNFAYPSLRTLAGRMLETMYREDGVGLAAPQVGLSIRLIVLNATGEPSGERVIVNPRVRSMSGQGASEEGCLSFPGIRLTVERATKIQIEYRDLDGRLHDLTADGFLSRVIQHEIDHLDGIEFIDRITPAQRSAVRSRLKELERRFKGQS